MVRRSSQDEKVIPFVFSIAKIGLFESFQDRNMVQLSEDALEKLANCHVGAVRNFWRG